MNDTIISISQLFQEMSKEEIENVLKCLNGYTKTYQKGEYIFRVGDQFDVLGLILSGGVRVELMDVWGHINIISYIKEGETFAETYACVLGEKMMVDVIAAKDSEVLFLDVNHIMETCSSGCHYHNQLIKNLIHVIAKKNLRLTRKLEHISSRTIRERLLSYLSYESLYQNKQRFDIPFNRQELADYLCVDRSAMSNELSKMQKEGLVEYYKNTFEIKSK